MWLNSFKNLQRTYLRDPLKYLELAFLSLMLLSLPSLEAPKNIFLILFLATSLYRQYLKKTKDPWKLWDWIFLSYIASAFLSAVFAGIPHGAEWGGFSSFLIWTGFAWLLSRTQYESKEITWIIWVTILGTLPPLAWGLIQYMVMHTKSSLELHSVGHVNHSAIYLGIILGAALSVTLTVWRDVGIIQRLTLILLPIVFFVAIIIGKSRGVFGISLIRLSLIILLIPNPKKIKAIAFALFTIILALMPLMNAAIIQKQVVNQNENNTLGNRDRVWNVSIEAARFYPIFGVGNGNWNRITLESVKKSREERGAPFDPANYSIEFHHSHSLYLTSLVERGVVGFIILMGFMTMWLITLIRSYHKLKISAQGSYVWGASLSAWIVTCGVGFVNSTFHHEHAILALLFLGLHLGYLKNQTFKPTKWQSHLEKLS
jgi:O-antigen ligase